MEFGLVTSHWRCRWVGKNRLCNLLGAASPAGKIYLGEQGLAARVATLRRKRYASVPADIKVALTRPDPRPPADLLNNARLGGVISFDEATGFPVSGHACADRGKESTTCFAEPNMELGCLRLIVPPPSFATALFPERRSNIQRGRQDKVENYRKNVWIIERKTTSRV